MSDHKRRNRNENAAVIATTVAAYYSRERRYEDMAKFSELMLRHDPTNISAIINRASAFGRIMERDFYIPYPQPEMVPAHMRGRYQYMAVQNEGGFNHAEALGWQEEIALRSEKERGSE